MTSSGRYITSPSFIYTLQSGELSAGETFRKGFSDNEVDVEDKYLPFNSIQVRNSSNQQLKLIIGSDDENHIIIPPLSIVEKEDKSIWNFHIVNNSDTDGNDDVIQIELERKITTQMYYRKMLGID